MNRQNPKRLYYLSMEFLIGRSLANNVTNLLLAPLTDQFTQDKKLNLLEILEQEPDAGLGNGGLGRLAACFIESAATLQLPAMGYGLRYEYGIFRQSIQNGWQQEMPDNWLRSPDPWEIARPNEKVEVSVGCSFELSGGSLRPVPGRPTTLIGIPFDRPVIGYGGSTINTLRLWAAAAPDFFNFEEFSHGDFVEAFTQTLGAETLTRVLYPDDSGVMGQGLRLLQEYFLVACSLADAVRRFQRSNSDWSLFAEKMAIQMNDTHPALAVPELMRILLIRCTSNGTKPGISHRTRWHTRIILCCPKRLKNGRWLGLKKCCPGNSRSSMKSIAVFWEMFAGGFLPTKTAFSA